MVVGPARWRRSLGEKPMTATMAPTTAMTAMMACGRWRRMRERSAQGGGVGFGRLLTLLGMAQFGLALFLFGGQLLVFGVAAGGQVVTRARRGDR